MTDNMFAWRILVSTDRYFMASKVRVATEPVSDLEIRRVIRKAISSDDCPKITTDDIEELVFMAVDDDNNVFQEDLPPYSFWPVAGDDIAAQKRAMFRR